MPKTKASSKSPIDAKRNTLVHALAWKWLEKNRPDVVKACRKAGEDKYPKSVKSRTTIELTGDLLEMK